MMKHMTVIDCPPQPTLDRIRVPDDAYLRLYRFKTPKRVLDDSEVNPDDERKPSKVELRRARKAQKAAEKRAQDERAASEAAAAAIKRSKPRLKSADEVYNRIMWDADLPDPSEFTIGYLDRFEGEMWAPLEEFDLEEIPFHRIRHFVHRGRVVWDRERRIDDVNALAAAH